MFRICDQLKNTTKMWLIAVDKKIEMQVTLFFNDE
jgi:hypothetical protein